MKLRTRALPLGGLAWGLLLLGTSWAMAQAPVREEIRTTQIRRISSLMGAPVQLQAGGTFGKVEDLVISDNGCIEYAVVGTEEKLIAVPFSLARMDFGRRVFTVDVERERFLKAPSFTRQRFPELRADSEFGRQVHTFFREHLERRRPEGKIEAPRERVLEPRRPEARPPEERKVPKARPPERRPLEERKPPEARPPERRPVEERKAPEKPKPPERRPPEERKPPVTLSGQ